MKNCKSRAEQVLAQAVYNLCYGIDFITNNLVGFSYSDPNTYSSECIYHVGYNGRLTKYLYVKDYKNCTTEEFKTLVNKSPFFQIGQDKFGKYYWKKVRLHNTLCKSNLLYSITEEAYGFGAFLKLYSEYLFIKTNRSLTSATFTYKFVN